MLYNITKAFEKTRTKKNLHIFQENINFVEEQQQNRLCNL